MGQNEVLALNDFYEDWRQNRFAETTLKANPFEFFCAEQFLKEYSLNDDEIVRGLVGSGDDGGIDAFYFFINKVLADDSSHVDRRSENDVDVVIMQIKETAGFSPTAIDKIGRFTDDLFDLKRTRSEYRYNYGDKLADLMSTFKAKMKGMAHANLSVDYYYVTRCDEEPDENAKRSAQELPKIAATHFRNAIVKPFNFAGALPLYEQTLVRRPSKKTLHFEKSIDTQEGWIGLVTLRTFYEFLRDDKHPEKLNESIFDDNVRGYFQNTAINTAITATLTTEHEPEFWILNNGITILTPKAYLSGDLEIRDPQIVNGLQTSRRIFDYFTSAIVKPEIDARRILVRVIQNQEPEVRDEIIRATNNQNRMPPEALISTSRLHKQIDAFFEKNGLFYDRRKGHYRDQGKPISKIVSILYLVQAVVAIMLRKPTDARGRPRDYVVKDSRRWSVFGVDDYRQVVQSELFNKYRPFDLEVYLRCVKILRRVDAFLDPLDQDNVLRRNVRFYLARYVSCAVTKNAYCPPGHLVAADVDGITDAQLYEGLEEITTIYVSQGANDEAAKNTDMSHC
ncbi:MAG: hypothetical protein JWN74_272 [Acidobacteriaceae bacterium]|nr:hypothetical protein [Acidobacteriaceae bacterium]